MNNEDVSRGMQHIPRRPMQPRYPEKNPMYSPSSNYNYNGNHNHNHQMGYNNGQNQGPRRRIDRYKRESLNFSEKIAKQNDVIIRLLKEIRDRLPPPPVSAIPETVSVAGEIERMETDASEHAVYASSEARSVESDSDTNPVDEADEEIDDNAGNRNDSFSPGNE